MAPRTTPIGHAASCRVAPRQCGAAVDAASCRVTPCQCGAAVDAAPSHMRWLKILKMLRTSDQVLLLEDSSDLQGLHKGSGGAAPKTTPTPSLAYSCAGEDRPLDFGEQAAKPHSTAPASTPGGCPSRGSNRHGKPLSLPHLAASVPTAPTCSLSRVCAAPYPAVGSSALCAAKVHGRHARWPVPSPVGEWTSTVAKASVPRQSLSLHLLTTGHGKPCGLPSPSDGCPSLLHRQPVLHLSPSEDLGPRGTLRHSTLRAVQA